MSHKQRATHRRKKGSLTEATRLYLEGTLLARATILMVEEETRNVLRDIPAAAAVH